MSNEHDGINLSKGPEGSKETTGAGIPPSAPENNSSNQEQPPLLPPYPSTAPQNPYAYGQSESGPSNYHGVGTEYPPNGPQIGQQTTNPYPGNGWNGQQYPVPSQYPGYNQGVPYQGGYMQTLPPSNGFGVTALVLGILAVLGCWIPYLNVFSILLGIGALIFGFMGIRKSHLPKGAAIAGLVTGGFAFLVASFIMLSIIISLASIPYGYDYENSGFENPGIENAYSITT